MPKKFYISLDLRKHSLVRARIQNESSDGSLELDAPAEGQIYWNTSSKKIRVYNGASWETLTTSAGSVASVTANEPIYVTGAGTDPVINIRDASGFSSGSMSVAHYNMVNSATSVNTASSLVLRDANGDFAGRDVTARAIRGIVTAQIINPTDAVNKDYVDGLSLGLRDFKDSVRLATTLNINISAPPATFDGITLTNYYDVGTRILVKDQTSQSQNGIYVWNGTGTPMTRAEDANTTDKLGPGCFVMVEEGDDYHDTGFVMNSDDHPAAFVLGASDCQWTMFGPLNQYSAGDGLAMSPTDPRQFNVNVDSRASGTKTTSIVTDEVRIDPNWAGHTAITTVGTLAIGTWNATAIGPTFGGTGIASYIAGDLLYASASNTLGRRSIGSTGNVLVVAGGVPAWGKVDLSSLSAVAGVLPIGSGGTNQTGFSSNTIVVFSSTGGYNGTSPGMASLGTAANGQIPIGRTGNLPVLATIAQGASNGVVVTNGSGSITLDTAQDIRTSASPTFSRINLSAASNQIVFQSAGVTGTVAWTPATINKTITLPDLSGTVMLINGGQTITGATWNAGTIGVAFGGTGANLSATGGTGQYVKQSSPGAAFTVGTIGAADLPGSFSGFGTPIANNVSLSAPAAGSATTAMRSDATFQLRQDIAPMWTATHTFVRDTALSNPGVVLSTSAADPANNVTHRPSPQLIFSAKIWNGTASTAQNFYLRAEGVYGQDTQHAMTIGSSTSSCVAISNVGGMSVGNNSWMPDGVVNAEAGFRVNNTATSNQVLKGNGTNITLAALADADIPSTLAAKTLQSCKFDPGLLDLNGNQMLIFNATASAVNYFELRNSTATNNLQLSMLGTGANLSLELKPKGTGSIYWTDTAPNGPTLRMVRAYQIPLSAASFDRAGASILMGTSIQITHRLGNRYPAVTLINNTTFQREFPQVQYDGADQVTLLFEIAPTDNAYTVEILG